MVAVMASRSNVQARALPFGIRDGGVETREDCHFSGHLRRGAQQPCESILRDRPSLTPPLPRRNASDYSRLCACLLTLSQCGRC